MAKSALEFRLGDRVAAVDGGREMRVSQVAIDFATDVPSIECGWFENGIPCTGKFDPDELRLVGEADRGE
ncbi:MAG TPA: hypothetical protein VGN57_12950 [Pirellulaceae bacterium]|jgi:uncharacterized protein YodC (DUF2158 family)|nr:hypothetical protein [Pirellulaceae bacterium]